MKLPLLIALAVPVCMSPILVTGSAVWFTDSASRLHALVEPSRAAQAPGEQAPALTCKSVHGQPMSWDALEGRAVILYFHSSGTGNAKAAIEQFREGLKGAAELKERCTVVLVAEDVASGQEARRALSSTGFQVEVGISSGSELFKSYGVVAFPTLFVVDGRARVVGSVRGYGTLFSFRALAACRYALGILDRVAYEKLFDDGRDRPRAQDLTSSRKYLMARQMLSKGKAEAALAILEDFACESPPRPQLVALITHLKLLGGDLAGAQEWSQRLAELEPDGIDTALLRARLELAGGDAEAARNSIRGLEASNPRTEFVRGLILEHDGRFEEAAAMYRGALGTTLFLPE